jgi:Tol biopolymer transport system component
MRRVMRVATIPTALCMLLLVVIAGPAGATFPGKNARIAFSLDTDSGIQINTIRPNGQDLQQITSLTENALGSDWSPDGTKIVFEFDASGDDFGYGCRIEMMNADGSDIVDLTPKSWVAKDGCAYNPSFTPDGKRIVFVATRCRDEIACPRTLWSMNLQGRNRRRIIHIWNIGSFDMHSPRVSPDGRWILFTVVDETVVVNGVHGNRKALYMVRPNGTHLTQVVPYRLDVCVCGGDWAPNQHKIVSSSQAGPTPVPGNASNLFTVRPDGTHLHYLTHSRNTDVSTGVGSYSPNGRWITYKRATASGQYRLMRIHPSGRGRSLIARLHANFYSRDWGSRPS